MTTLSEIKGEFDFHKQMSIQKKKKTTTEHQELYFLN